MIAHKILCPLMHRHQILQVEIGDLNTQWRVTCLSRSLNHQFEECWDWSSLMLRSMGHQGGGSWEWPCLFCFFLGGGSWPMLSEKVPSTCKQRMPRIAQSWHCYLAGQSQVVLGMLENPHLQDLLLRVDSAANPEREIHKAMLEPLFVELADECLQVVEPDKQDSPPLQRAW